MISWRTKVDCVHEEAPGRRWREHFAELWPGYDAWLESRRWRPAAGRMSPGRRLSRDLPELAPTFERLAALAAAAGGDRRADAFLALFTPPPFLAGCSLLATCGDGEPVLLRSYEYGPERWEGRFWQSRWRGRSVVASSDCLWGALDGMNEDGLVVALAFGGRRVVGPGYGIPILVRYLLEACRDVQDCRQALPRLRSHMAYNLLVLDRGGDTLLAELAPDRPCMVSRAVAVTNHQSVVDWPEYVSETASRQRLDQLEALVRAGGPTRRLIEAFRRPPIHRRAFGHDFGTLYTAVYRPAHATVEVLIEDASFALDVTRPADHSIDVTYREATTDRSRSPRESS